MPCRPVVLGAAATAALLVVVGSSCGGGSDEVGGGTVTVFAAASLTAAFTDIGAAFMAEHPDQRVELSFAASSDLVRQIEEGAPADVFASADQANMLKLTEGAGTVGELQVFATNRLQIIVAPGNPMGIATLSDLADPDLIFVTAAPEVPIGRYTSEVLDRAGVTVTPKSLEENVKAIVTKVTLGEADAGIVYATDVLDAADEAEGIAIPADLVPAVDYPIAVSADASDPDGGTELVAFVLSPAGQEILQSYGFGPP